MTAVQQYWLHRNEPVDPLYANVLVLVQGANGFVDKSPLATAIGSSGVSLDATRQHLGFDTFRVSSNNHVRVTDDTYINAACGSGAWCYELWYRPDTEGAITAINSFGKFSSSWFADGRMQMACSNIAGTSYVLSTVPGAVPANTWHHIALVRDKSDSVFDYLRLYLDGVFVETSTGIGKSDFVSPGVGLGRFMGNHPLSGTGNFAGFRFTVGNRRYSSGFTPPSAPFPTQ